MKMVLTEIETIMYVHPVMNDGSLMAGR